MSEGLEAYQSGGNRHNPQPLLRLQFFEPTRATFRRLLVHQACASHARWYKMGFKARVLCKRSSVALVQEPWRHKVVSRDSPRVRRSYAQTLHSVCRRPGCFINLSGRHSRSKRTSANAFTGLGGIRRGCNLCVDSVRDGRPPGAPSGIQILCTGTRLMASPRSVRRLRLRLGRDRPAVSICFFHASVHGDILKNFAHCLSDSVPVLKHL